MAAASALAASSAGIASGAVADAPADVAESAEPTTTLELASTKRPRTEDTADALVELEPVAKISHSGMFREQTLQHVSKVVEQLQIWMAPQTEGPAPEHLLEVLEELADCVVDERVLERTGIGKQVTALQKFGHDEVAERSRALVQLWKRDRETRMRVYKSFMEKGQLSKKEARKLEEGLFYAACPMGYLDGEGFRSYQRHFQRLAAHLRKKGPGTLAQRLKDQELDPIDVAFRPDEELWTAEQRLRAEADRKAGLEEALASKGAELEGTVTTEYMCPRCNSTHTVYKEMQTGWHSDQQDVTILVRCLDCGERWKANDDHGGNAG